MGKVKACKCGGVPRRNQGYCNPCFAAKQRGYRKLRKQNDEQRAKSNCRSYLNVYVKRGKVKKEPCVFCGSPENVEGHHEDYTKPLQVDWVCKTHHVMLTNGLVCFFPRRS